MSQRIVITGATGQVGRPLVAALAARGDEVVVLSRRVDTARRLLPQAADVVPFDLDQPKQWQPALDGAQAVIVLGGAPFFRKWSSWEEFERVATGGRIATNRAIVTALEHCQQRPAVLVTASAVGAYGFHGSDEIVTEDTPPGTDRWARGTLAWEQEAARAESLGIRTVWVRTGIVLSPDDGMAAQMRTQFRRGFGAIALPRTQWLPWIHIDDEIMLFTAAIDDSRIRGPMNASAPNPLTYREFAQAMGKALQRPVLLRLPGVVLRWALGDVADSVLHNRRMIPSKALNLGLTFQHETILPTLNDLLND